MKILTAENHKYCEKIRKNRQKKATKSDKLSLFQSTLVVFCRCLKSDKKCDKSDKLSLFRFVGAHPRPKFLKIFKKIRLFAWISTQAKNLAQPSLEFAGGNFAQPNSPNQAKISRSLAQPSLAIFRSDLEPWSRLQAIYMTSKKKPRGIPPYIPLKTEKRYNACIKALIYCQMKGISWKSITKRILPGFS